MAFSLKGKIVIDIDGVLAYPDVLTFNQMREAIDMKPRGTVTIPETGVTLKAPFAIHTITYGDSMGSPNWYSQLIYDEGVEIGALNTYYIENKLHETFQTCRKYREYYDQYNWAETEDEGYIFVQFGTIEELINFIRNEIADEIIDKVLEEG